MVPFVWTSTPSPCLWCLVLARHHIVMTVFALCKCHPYSSFTEAWPQRPPLPFSQTSQIMCWPALQKGHIHLSQKTGHWFEMPWGSSDWRVIPMSGHFQPWSQPPPTGTTSTSLPDLAPGSRKLPFQWKMQSTLHSMVTQKPSFHSTIRLGKWYNCRQIQIQCIYACDRELKEFKGCAAFREITVW